MYSRNRYPELFQPSPIRIEISEEDPFKNQTRMTIEPKDDAIDSSENKGFNQFLLNNNKMGLQTAIFEGYAALLDYSALKKQLENYNRDVSINKKTKVRSLESDFGTLTIDKSNINKNYWISATDKFIGSNLSPWLDKLQTIHSIYIKQAISQKAFEKWDCYNDEQIVVLKCYDECYLTARHLKALCSRKVEVETSLQGCKEITFDCLIIISTMKIQELYGNNFDIIAPYFECIDLQNT